MQPQQPPRKPVEEMVAVAAMALLVLITLANVLVRYLTNESFAWTEEISVFLMVLMALAGASAVAGRDRHIRIEFFYTRRRLRLLSAAASTAVFLLLAVLFARWTWDQYRFAETSMGLGVPLWWYGIAMPVLCAAIAWRCLMWLRHVLAQR